MAFAGGPFAQQPMAGQSKDPRTQYSQTTPNGQFLNAYGTNPRVQWASMGDEWQTDDTGVSQTTNQFFATRVKARIAGGKWLALAPVFFGGKQTSTKSPVGTNSPKVTLTFNLELANGTLTPTVFTCPNTGGTILQGTFMGATDGILRPGDLLVGDFIYASAASLPYFEWTDRAKLPWIRIAWSKGSSSDSLFATTCTEYNYPWNSHFAACTSYATAKTLINTSGISSYNGGTDHWGSSDTSLPGCLGFIGIGLDGQKSLIFFGTSIMDGDGSAPKQWGGVDPANNTPANYDTLGFPAAYAQNLNNQVPCMNFGVGASSSDRLWALSGTSPDWVTNTEDVALQRGTISKLAKWFDIVIPYDPQNDNLGTLPGCIENFTATVRASNPAIKVYSVIVPNGYVDASGATVAYDSGNLDPKYACYATALTNGWIHGTLNLCETGQQIYADLGAQVTSTTTSDGSTTTLNDSGATWKKNQWASSFVTVGGVTKLISGNTRTQLTFSAFAGAVLSGTAYVIQGNTSGDGIHPSEVGQQRLGTNFKSAISAYENIPYFTRSQ